MVYLNKSLLGAAAPCSPLWGLAPQSPLVPGNEPYAEEPVKRVAKGTKTMKKYALACAAAFALSATPSFGGFVDQCFDENGNPKYTLHQLGDLALDTLFVQLT